MMNQKLVYTCSLFCLALLMVASCKKVENDFARNNQQISLSNSSSSIYFVGDTAVFSGILFAKNGQLSITIGGIAAPIVKIDSTIAYVGNELGVGTVRSIDQVSVIITKVMGVGTDRPLIISNNGSTIYPPAITIQQYGVLASRTDTTLVVKNVMDWKPDDLISYNARTILENVTVSGQGDVYFYNSRLIARALKYGPDKLLEIGINTIDNVPVMIREFIGLATSYDGKTLFFSCSTENQAGEPNAFSGHMLCKYSVESRQISNINETIDDPSYSGDGGPFEGAATQVKIIASNLQVDVNDNLFFLNNFAYTDAGVQLANLCRLSPEGLIKSLFVPTVFGTNTAAPGKVIGATLNYLPVPGKDQMWAISDIDPVGAVRAMTLYRISDLEPLSTFATDGSSLFPFRSFDTSALSGYNVSGQALQPFLALTSRYGAIPNNYEVNYLPVTTLANGELLEFRGPSMVAYDPDAILTYCYAGTEKGIFDQAPTSQTGVTGKAKWVNFATLDGVPQLVTGSDKLGTTYFFVSVIDLNTYQEIGVKIFSLGKP